MCVSVCAIFVSRLLSFDTETVFTFFNYVSVHVIHSGIRIPKLFLHF